jgi:hypothetical protein
VYCVTTASEGAAGSTYMNYAYVSAKGNRLIEFSFSLRFVQCGNYDEPTTTACETERTAFNIDSIVDRIVQTAQLPAAAPPSTTQGIRGTVMVGPTCPGPRGGPADGACADKPYATSLDVTTVDGSRTIKTFASAADGTFQVTLPPGEYAIKNGSTQVLPRCSSAGTFTVTAGSFATVPVSCDSGMR